ncbi:uncharacterized protein UDID_17117 [Ustilago sp. UG-2017a]|nr:uncharacterized protein UDID_17117 [Ustilago sp. UG-2017a]
MASILVHRLHKPPLALHLSYLPCRLVSSRFPDPEYSDLTHDTLAMPVYLQLKLTQNRKNTPSDPVKWTHFFVTLQNEVRMHGCTSACFTLSHCADARMRNRLLPSFITDNVFDNIRVKSNQMSHLLQMCFLDAPKWGVQKREKVVKIEKHVFLKTLEN